MRTYRFYFYGSSGDMRGGRFDFQADNDDQAEEIGEILFDAVSDRCQSFEIWDGDVVVVSGPRTIGPRLRASNLTQRRQDNIIGYEANVNSKLVIASSERLHWVKVKNRAHPAYHRVRDARLRWATRR